MKNERISADAKQINEMNLGVNSIKFQYLHILTLLLKGDRSSDLRLSCAREAISLLPSLVSNWGSVYNGVIWYDAGSNERLEPANHKSRYRQLLYYPFAPFFVIFENIIHQPSQYPTLEQDLRLLATTVTYFTEMRLQMRLLAGVCSKLQHTAAVFLQLAQSHTRHSTSAKPSADTSRFSEQSNSSRLGGHATQSWDDSINADLDGHEFMNYLNCLPADMNDTSQILETELQVSKPQHLDGEQETSSAYLQRPTSDCAFDWFLWNDYYGNTGI
jgi:hypothetical protein